VGAVALGDKDVQWLDTGKGGVKKAVEVAFSLVVLAGALSIFNWARK